MFMGTRKDLRFIIIVISLSLLAICVTIWVTKPNSFTRNVCHLSGMDRQRVGHGVVCVDSDGVLYSRTRLAEIMEKNDG